MHESDDQIGAAHLIEHMAFRGTASHDAEALTSYFHSAGIRVGTEVNAFTEYDRTVYSIQVPTADDSTLAQAIEILAGWAHTIEFSQSALEKEWGSENQYIQSGRKAFRRPVVFTRSEARVRDVLVRAWDEYYRRWRRYALSLSHDPDKAEEIVQEAVARTIQASPTFDETVDAHYYVRKAIRTTAVATWRDTARNTELDEQAPAAGPDPLQEMLLRHAGHVDRRLAKRLVAAIDALPEQNRRAIRMRYLLRPPLKLRDMARIEGRAISTIHGRIEIGKLHIAAMLREDEDASER